VRLGHKADDVDIEYCIFNDEDRISDMKRPALLRAGLLGLLLAAPAVRAEPPSCDLGSYCAAHQSIAFYSVNDGKPYAILLRAPESLACPDVRYRLIDAEARLVGDTPPLAQGQIAVLRIGQDYARGPHSLTVMTEGPCEARPQLLRPLRLNKPSPDHSWRSN
jgi:hypothetical protein